MILLSLVACVASSIFLVAIGGETKYGLYAGTGIFNFLYDIEIDIKKQLMKSVIKENLFVFIFRATWIIHILAIWCLLFMDSSKGRHIGSTSINILYWVK